MMEQKAYELAEDADSDMAQAGALIACALFSVARALRDLGNGNAATQMGAIEAMSLKISESIDSISDAISRV